MTVFNTPPTSKKLAKDREAQNRRIMTLRLRLVAFAMLAASSAAMRMAPLAPRSVVRSRVVAQQRFSDPILDEKIPDPIYDEETGYLGKSPIGFVQDAESFNGRAAMAGFTICFLQEIVLGKGECSLLRNQRSAHAAAAALWSPGGGSGGPMVKWARCSAVLPALAAPIVMRPTGVLELYGLPYDVGAVPMPVQRAPPPELVPFLCEHSPPRRHRRHRYHRPH